LADVSVAKKKIEVVRFIDIIVMLHEREPQRFSNPTRPDVEKIERSGLDHRSIVGFIYIITILALYSALV